MHDILASSVGHCISEKVNTLDRADIATSLNLRCVTMIAHLLVVLTSIPGIEVCNANAPTVDEMLRKKVLVRAGVAMMSSAGRSDNDMQPPLVSHPSSGPFGAPLPPENPRVRPLMPIPRLPRIMFGVPAWMSGAKLVSRSIQGF